MNSIEFNKKCQPLNLKYRDLFGYVPCKDDYVCSQDGYLEALSKAGEEEQELEVFLRKRDRKRQLDPRKSY